MQFKGKCEPGFINWTRKTVSGVIKVTSSWWPLLSGHLSNTDTSLSPFDVRIRDVRLYNMFSSDPQTEKKILFYFFWFWFRLGSKQWKSQIRCERPFFITFTLSFTSSSSSFGKFRNVSPIPCGPAWQFLNFISQLLKCSSQTSIWQRNAVLKMSLQ